jgi:transketolase
MTKNKIAYLKSKALWVRQQTLKMACGAGEGHIASSFSCTEIMVCLYQGGVLNVDPKHPKWSERDRFLLSKGQAALALYPILADMGFFLSINSVPLRRMEAYWVLTQMMLSPVSIFIQVP